VHPITGKKLAGLNAENGPPVEIGEDAYQDVPSIGRWMSMVCGLQVSAGFTVKDGKSSWIKSISVENGVNVA
jgi:hypothetical protein